MILFISLFPVNKVRSQIDIDWMEKIVVNNLSIVSYGLTIKVLRMTGHRQCGPLYINLDPGN